MDKIISITLPWEQEDTKEIQKWFEKGYYLLRWESYGFKVIFVLRKP